jgi:hypothetical protein
MQVDTKQPAQQQAFVDWARAAGRGELWGSGVGGEGAVVRNQAKPQPAAPQQQPDRNHPLNARRERTHQEPVSRLLDPTLPRCSVELKPIYSWGEGGGALSYQHDTHLPRVHTRPYGCRKSSLGCDYQRKISLSPGKRLHHQRSSRHAMVPLSDTRAHLEG